MKLYRILPLSIVIVLVILNQQQSVTTASASERLVKSNMMSGLTEVLTFSPQVDLYDIPGLPDYNYGHQVPFFGLNEQREYIPPLGMQYRITQNGDGKSNLTHHCTENDYINCGAIDIQTQCDKPIYAVYSGWLVYNDYADGFGNLIIIQHDDSSAFSYYAHRRDIDPQKDPAALVNLPRGLVSPHSVRIQQGQLIGYSGGTGGVPCHLHFGMTLQATSDPGTSDYVYLPVDLTYFPGIKWADPHNPPCSYDDGRCGTITGVPELFSSTNFTGNSQAFGFSNWDLSTQSIGNDTVRSLRVPPDYTVSLYKDTLVDGLGPYDFYVGPNESVTDLDQLLNGEPRNVRNDQASAISVDRPNALIPWQLIIPIGDSQLFYSPDLRIGFDFISNQYTGTLTVNRYLDTPAPARGILLANSYWGINSTLPVGTFRAKIIFHYEEDDLTSARISENNLTVYSHDGDGWTEAKVVDRDPQNNTITVEVDKFSNWVLGSPTSSSPELAYVENGTLVLNMGSEERRNARHIAIDEINEDFVVKQQSTELPGEFSVSAFGLTQVFTGVTQIFADGDDGDDVILLEPGTDDAANSIAFTAPAELQGGSGDDQIHSGDGNDTLSGGSGNDEISGSGGDDAIVGDDGDDSLSGGDGSDIISGDAGNDHIDGGNDSDTLSGGSGSDTIHGDAGNDQIQGGDDNDDLHGGSGNDTINGDSGDDHIEGDEGDDVLYGDETLACDADGLIPNALSGGNDIILGGAGHDQIFGGSGTDTLNGNEGDDYICGNSEDDTIYGGAGNDVMHGGAGDDYMEGNSDADTMYGDEGQDDMMGGTSMAGTSDGQDTMYGGADHDVMVGDNGSITRSLEGDQWIRDTFSANAADVVRRDIVLFDVATTSFSPSLGMYGGDQMYGEGGYDIMYGQGGNDAMWGGPDEDYMEGNAGGDTMYGDAGQDDIIGGTGLINDDPLQGINGRLDGNDQMYGESDASEGLTDGDGADVMLGDNGIITRLLDGDGMWQVRPANGAIVRVVTFLDVETLTDSADLAVHGDDTIYGNDNDDTLYGQGGEDQLHGGAGDDYMEGNTNSDVMYGDTGDDDMLGGTGPTISNDPSTALPGRVDSSTLTRTVPLGTDPVASVPLGDVMYGGEGSDVMLGDNGIITRPVDENGQWLTLHYTLFADTDGSSAPRHTTNGTNERIDRVVLFVDLEPGLTAGSDLMYGGLGDDDLYGQFDDTSGPPHIAIGDELLGETGEDAMIGDLGIVSSWVITGKTQIIHPPEPFIDDNILVQGTLFRQVTLQQAEIGGNDRMLGGPGGDWMHGGAGNDLINGNSGNDRLFGDDGADVMWGGPDHDHLWGGYGDDYLDVKPRPEMTIGNGKQGKGKSKTIPADPLEWFLYGREDNFQGIDYIYGGWDQDAMQADVADTGPVHGDRLVDWVGDYNVYYLCPGLYGEYVVTRDHSPHIVSFLQDLAAGDGAVNTTINGSSGFNEIAIVFSKDMQHNSQPSHPDNPGHFTCDQTR